MIFSQNILVTLSCDATSGLSIYVTISVREPIIFQGANGSPQVSMNAKQASRTLLLKQLARDLCISERRILYRTQYVSPQSLFCCAFSVCITLRFLTSYLTLTDTMQILRRRLRDMRGGELRALSLFNGLRNLFK